MVISFKEMTKSELSVWTFSDKEISELKPEFEKEFETNLMRDYENDWEWIWNGSQPENKINISLSRTDIALHFLCKNKYKCVRRNLLH